MTKKTAKTDNKQQKTALATNTVLKITIPKEEAKEAYTKTLNRMKKKVKAPGFRVGNVPSKIAEEQLGIDHIIEHALQLVVPDKYAQAVKESGKTPITQPEFQPIKLEKDSDWEIEAHIAERPEVKLKSYKTAVKTAIREADEHIKEQIAEAKKAAKKAKKSAEKGKEADQTSAQAPITEPTEEQRKDHRLHHIYQKLIETSGPDVPEILVKNEVRFDLENLVRRLEGMNMKLDDFLKHQGATFEQLSGQMAAEALGRLQLTFVLDAIAEKEGLKVSKKEIEEQVDKIEDKKVREEQRQDQQYRALVEQTLKRRKVAEYLANLK